MPSTISKLIDTMFPLWEHEDVRVISRKAILEFLGTYPDAAVSLEHWLQVSRRAEWRNLTDVREDFRHAGGVGKYTVFNISGNKYRLIATVKYKWQVVYIRHILTHAGYDRGGWKK